LHVVLDLQILPRRAARTAARLLPAPTVRVSSAPWASHALRARSGSHPFAGGCGTAECGARSQARHGRGSVGGTHTDPLRQIVRWVTVRLAFTERCDSGYRFPIGIPTYQFHTYIPVF